MLDRDALLAKMAGPEPHAMKTRTRKGGRRPLVMAVSLGTLIAAQARVHELKLLPQNVHWGYYDPSVKPVLRVASGDTVRVETMIARGLPRLRAAGVKEDEIPESLKLVERTITERGPGAHPMTGPDLRRRRRAGRRARGEDRRLRVPASVRRQRLHPRRRHAARRVSLRAASTSCASTTRAGTAAFAPGITLKLAPFFGSIGVAPNPLVGRISSGPPGPHAGNLDNKELVAGSTLYIPVAVPGALISFGDGHAMQGDGEATLTALETSLRGTVQITVRKGMALKWPRAETPTHYIAMGLHTDLDEAAKLAVKEMIDFLVSEKKMNRDEAYILCSVAVDLHVTQLVDGTKGVHAMLAKSMFTR